MDGKPATSDEARLFARYRDGDQAARDELVERFLPLAQKLARRYGSRADTIDDLVQVASVGLIKAVDRFDPERGTSFSTFAVPTILGELKRHFRDTGWTMRVPRSVQELALKVERVLTNPSTGIGRTPTAAEVAAHLEVDVEQVLEAMDAVATSSTISLDAPRSSDGDSTATVADIVGEEDLGFDMVEYGSSIAPIMDAMPKRDRLIVHMRFVEDMTQAEIAERIGISQMHVSRLLRRAVERLRAAHTTG